MRLFREMILLFFIICISCPNLVFANNGLRERIYVPYKMITGSNLKKNRKFYKTTIPEKSLAGIKLGSQYKNVLLRWGNPTRITCYHYANAGRNGPMLPQLESESTTAVGMAAPGGAGPGGAPGMPPAPGGGVMAPGGMGGMAPAMPGGGRGMPPLPGVGGGGPGMPPAPGGGMAPPRQNVSGDPNVPRAQVSGNASSQDNLAVRRQVLNEDDIAWTYELDSGEIVDFIITKGIVTQINVISGYPSNLSKTLSGIQIGDSYKLIKYVYGFANDLELYPIYSNSSSNSNDSKRFYKILYVSNRRTAFMLDGFWPWRVIGITISLRAGDPESFILTNTN